MNHPNKEEWMAYLYGELPRASQASLNAHLKVCAECRQNIGHWRTAMSGLGKWRLASAPVGLGLANSKPVKWALAALLVLGLGCGVGRLSAPKVDVEAIMAAVEKPLRESLTAQIRQDVREQVQADWQAVLSGEPNAVDTDFRRELRAGLDHWTTSVLAAASTQNQQLFTEFAEATRAGRLQDQRAFLTALDESEQQNRAEQIKLRRALETVAVVAADKFQRTESELGQLASYAQAQSISDQSDQPIESSKPLNRKGN
jgi:hypothetical protein